MRAFTLDGFGAAPGLREDLREPHAADGGLVVRVHASSVNPVDAFIAGGGLKEMAEYRFPVILGRDFGGVVEEVGAGVSRFRAGDEVFGFVRHGDPAVENGSWADLTAIPDDDHVAPKPRGVLRVHVQRTYPLEEAGVALAALSAEHTQGKLAVTVT